MPFKEEKTLIARIEECYRTPFKEFLISSIKPAISISTKDEELHSSQVSQMGGIPLINKNEEWPRSKDDNKPFLFLLQVDLSELSNFRIELGLPTEGIISFYFPSSSWEGGVVKYYENKEDLMKAKLPKEYFEEENRKNLPFWKRLFTKEESFRIFKECKIDFSLEYDIPSYDSLQVELFEKENSIRIFDFRTDDLLIEKYFLNDDGFGRHHLLGYYRALQDSKYELPRREYDRFLRMNNSKKVIEEGLEWRILLKLGSDKLASMNWVDAGNLFFFIREKDFSNLKFDEIRAYLDTT